MTTQMQLRRLVRSRIGVPLSDDFMPSDVLNDAINEAIEAIETEHRWPWQEQLSTVTITAPATSFTPEATWLATKALYNGDQEIRLVSALDLLQWSSAAAGDPQVYAPVGGVIEVRPAGASNLTLRHLWYKQATLLDEDTDEPEIPSQFSGAIVAKAAELLSAREGDRGAQVAHQADYAGWIARMRRSVRRTVGPSVPRVRPGSWV